MNRNNLLLPKPFQLSGRIAVITGGAGLLGIQHAHALAELGASVVIADIDLSRAEHQAAKIQGDFGKNTATFLVRTHWNFYIKLLYLCRKNHYS